MILGEGGDDRLDELTCVVGVGDKLHEELVVGHAPNEGLPVLWILVDGPAVGALDAVRSAQDLLEVLENLLDVLFCDDSLKDLLDPTRDGPVVLDRLRPSEVEVVRLFTLNTVEVDVLDLLSQPYSLPFRGGCCFTKKLKPWLRGFSR